MATQERLIVDVTTSLSTIFTGGVTWGAGKSQIVTLQVSNDDSVDRWFGLIWTPSGGADRILFPQETIGPKKFFLATLMYSIQAGDLLKVVGSADNVLDILLNGFGGVA